MKSLTLPLLAAVVAASTTLAQAPLDLKDAKIRASYAIGADIARSLKNQPIELDPKALAQGLTDTLAGKGAMNDAEMQAAMTELRMQLMEKMQAKQKSEGAANLKAGQDFLAANGKKEGVKTTASGLQYKVVKSGSGKTPTAKDTVKVHYHGTLIDGSVFDSSVERGEPISFPVNGVIAGWTEALQLMKEGDKWQLTIPSELAYGEDSPSPKIGANSVLQFDVELLAVEKAN